MKKLSVYRTFSFWFCLGMAWVNLVLFFIASRIHSPYLMALAALTIIVSFLGAFAHWYLERLYAKRQRRD